MSKAASHADSHAALATVRPVESLVVPELLDGRDGTNRGALENSQLSARNDLDAVRAWLSNYADTKTTSDNYRKEAERLLLWAVVQLGKPLSSLTHEDLLLFKAFIADPQPAARWVSASGGKFARGDERWRPFNGPLSPASQRQALIILNAMFTWLVNAGYLRGNPMALLRQRAKRSAPRVTRYLSVSLWDEVKLFVEQLPRDTDAQRAYYARCRWLSTLFYLQGMRISEVAGGQMGQFFRRLGADGQDQWWLETLGKGDKERIVPVSGELIQELRSYRTMNGLPALPSRSEDTPLVLPFKGRNRCLSRSAIHDAIKGIFAGAATWLRARGPQFADRADELERASAHWLRHTAGSHQADGGVDLRTIRDNLGHVSLNTTSLYLHTEDDTRHTETVKRHRMNWDTTGSKDGKAGGN
ncbi:tyrosine-type recombinase/integrase [Paraburkholderia sp. MMS20-SJTR3]|uniref:Tyrosine-type recombinase/integrase n=1 Tax=Paraburkholderia sejongensis TaxID=2886946 RepID=A0ABS8JP72_9BURK|nr:tyrosine-type recombinase/integrase [Paraburkholderia sp. MMS20-SJTR3]MCC8391513.1 tyrosine-type recombinase/integrase [Paraburkholderia sp. MMS20-SJTR3]